MSRSSQKVARTPAQIAASRENGKKSHGPNDTSNTRFNAIKHGILGCFIRFDTDEDREVAGQLSDGIIAEWEPQTQSEHFYVERNVQCMWRLRLAEKRLWERPKNMDETYLLVMRYERDLSREITLAEGKLRELRREREQREEKLRRRRRFDETNPSGDDESGADELLDASAVETLRRLTRVFEVTGGASPEDQDMLKRAARTHLSLAVPKLEFRAQKAPA